MNTALYPVEKIEWCVYALFIKDHELINTNYLLASHTLHANFAINLDGFMWAVPYLATEHVQIHCLEGTHIKTILSPLTLIYVGNGCEGYSMNTYIPYKSD